MIYGYFHPGSGLGNMLHRYVATRITAERLGVDFSMINKEGFKGKSFINLDMGKPQPKEWTEIVDPSGRIIIDTHFVDDVNEWYEWNKFVYDPDFDFIEDNTIVDGNFEDSKYFEDKIDKIDEWLRTDGLEIPDDVCMIGFRGGEYYVVPELGLPKEWYNKAIKKMQELGINKFKVHTDDPDLAKQFFPDYEIIKDISLNWRAMRYAHNAIIANSSFYVLPRLLANKHMKAITIAPRWWNRYNTKKWDYPQNYYKQFTYIE